MHVGQRMIVFLYS